MRDPNPILSFNNDLMVDRPVIKDNKISPMGQSSLRHEYPCSRCRVNLYIILPSPRDQPP